MNPIQAIATLRKFANYLVGIFPFLAIIGDRLYALAKGIGNLPLVKPVRIRLAQSAAALAIWKFFERFYWRDYAKDRMELGDAPAETTLVLRAMIQMCVLLSIIIPLAQLQVAPVNIETLSGYKHVMSSWPIVLWILCLPCAWASLLIGAAVCNRIAFAAVAVGVLYFLSNCVLYLPRSYLNSLLTLPILFSLYFCLSILSIETRRAKVMQLITALTVGAAAGFQFTILTPLRPWLGTVLPWNGPAVGVGAGCAIGICAGMVCLASANKWREKITTSITISKAFSLVSVLLICFLGATALRGGLPQLGGAIISSLDLSNAYLWPVLYFVGVGIVHKLMGSSKVVAASASGILPPKLVTPGFLLLLVVATSAAWSEDIVTYLSFETSVVGQQAFYFFLPFFKSVKSVIWHDPLLSMATQWMKWVLAFECALVAMLGIQKRLSSATLSRLFFTSCLAALLLWEYVFQMSSFARSPIHSVVLVFLFAVWLLWLMHTIGWKLSLKSSPMWPSRGRLAIYGGIAGLLILQVNARSMCSDYRIVNELFLTMFRGVIDVGLPYYLLLWVNKRIKEATPPVGVLLGSYAAGAAASMCSNALDKCFTKVGCLEVVQTQLQQLQSTGNLTFDIQVSWVWLVFRAAAFVALLALVRKVADILSARVQDSRHPQQRFHWMLYLMTAFASGMVSFSYTFVDLPIPNELRVALAPLHQEVLFNCNVFHLYLAYWIPALLMSLAALRSHSNLANLWSTLAATAICGGILAVYEHGEVLMRASGLLMPAMVGLGACLVVLIALILQTLESEAAKDSKGETEDSTRENTGEKVVEKVEKVDKENVGAQSKSDALLPYKWSACLVTALAVVFAVSSLLSPEHKTFSTREIPSLKHSVLLANDWNFKETTHAKAPYPEVSMFTRKAQGSAPFLQVMSLASDPAGVKPLMKKWIDFLHLNVTKVESLERYQPGAYCFQFTIPDSSGISMFAVSAFVPRASGQTEVFTAVTDAANFEQTSWEVKLLVKSLESLCDKFRK